MEALKKIPSTAQFQKTSPIETFLEKETKSEYITLGLEIAGPD